ncbi:MAG: hypothetical protein ACI9OJ_000767, partial [Myxococcota bacterium]
GVSLLRTVEPSVRSFQTQPSAQGGRAEAPL